MTNVIHWHREGFNATILKAKDIAAQAARAVDFISNPTVNGVGYLVLSEFHPVDIPPLIVDTRNSDIVVDSSLTTKNKDVRANMAKHIPCVTPEEVERSFKCPDSLFDELLKKDGCRKDRIGITAQILNLRDSLLTKQKLINGELRVGTIDVKNDLSKLTEEQKIAIGLIASSASILPLVPLTALTLAIYFAVEGTKTHKERVATDEKLLLWPDSLQALVRKKLEKRENECVDAQTSQSKTTKFCTTAFLDRKRLNLFSDAGQEFLSFEAGVVSDEYGITLSSEGTPLPAGFGKGPRYTPASDSKLDENTSVVYQRFNFVGTDAAPAPSRTKEEVDNLVAAVGNETARSILKSRGVALDEAMVTIENIFALVSEPSYYDCSEVYSHKVCIRENAVVTNADLNDNLIGSDATVRKLDGANGCLVLSIPVGESNCLWYMHDGIQSELDELNILTAREFTSREEIIEGPVPPCVDGYQFKHPVSGTPLDLKVDCKRLPEVSSRRYTPSGPVHRFTGDTDGVVYAVYMRMIAELMVVSDIPAGVEKWPEAIKSYMSARGLPVSHVLFDVGKGFTKDTTINLAAARANDDHIDAYQVNESKNCASAIFFLNLTRTYSKSFFLIYRTVSMVSELQTTKLARLRT